MASIKPPEASSVVPLKTWIGVGGAMLVVSQSGIDGYSRLSLILASLVVNRQLIQLPS